MKKALIFIGMTLLTASVFAENLKGGVDSSIYPDCFDSITLTETQKLQILKIRNEENFVLKPLILDIESKERGIEFLKGLQCDFFDSTCKKKLKEDIEQREFEKKEVLRRIEQKKGYYNLRYRSVLTRAQDIEIQKVLEENAHKEKVLGERAEKAKKQEKIDKLKVWKKFSKKK